MSTAKLSRQFSSASPRWKRLMIKTIDVAGMDLSQSLYSVRVVEIDESAV